MTYEFNGQQFDSAKAWSAAFPAFGRHFWKYVVAGAKNPTEVEVMAYRNNAAGAKRSKASARARMTGKLRSIVG